MGDYHLSEEDRAKVRAMSPQRDRNERESAKQERIKRVLQRFNYNHQVNFKAYYAFGKAGGNWLTKDEEKTIDDMERE